MFSTITRKVGVCCDCAPNGDFEEKPIISGRCHFHYRIHRNKIMIEKQKEKAKVQKLRNTPANLDLAIKNGKLEKYGEFTPSQRWYQIQMVSNERICSNCGLSLYHYSDEDWFGSQNHIVDKSPTNGCPSVATHILNHNVLGLWCCHGQWGTSFLNQSKMKCFPAAKEKFQLFMQFIAPAELKKVNPYLLSVDTNTIQPSTGTNGKQDHNEQKENI